MINELKEGKVKEKEKEKMERKKQQSRRSYHDPEIYVGFSGI